MSKFCKHLFITIIAALSFAPVNINNTYATGPRLQVDITNSSAPAPTPDPSSTGAIEWITERTAVVGDGEDMVVEIDYDLSLFKELTVNGQLLAPNVDYMLEEGSTVITLQGAYLASLSADTYNLTAYYTDGAYFSTAFLIANTPADATAATIGTPDTGFNPHDNGYTTAANIFTIIVSVIAIVAIAVFVVYCVKHYRDTRRRLRNCSKTHSQFRFQLPQIQLPQIQLRRPHFTLHPHKAPLIIASTALVIGGATFGLSSLGVFNNDNSATAFSPNEESLSILVPEQELVATADLADGSQFITLSQDLIVEPATGWGYKLYISTSSNQYSDLSINGSISAEERISATDGTLSHPATLPGDSWGYAVSGGSFGGNYTPSQQSKWAGVPVAGSDDLIISKDSATSANDTTKVYYGFNITNNLPDGSYWGTDNHTVVYTAISNAAPPNTITYNCNGGTGSAEQSKNVGTEIALSDGSPCSKVGSEITSWNTSSNGTGTTYDLGATYSDDANLALYAVWTDVPTSSGEAPAPTRTYTLKYNTNGGANGPSTQSGSNTSTSYQFTISSATPTRDGYIFQGWATSSSATTAAYQPGAAITVTNSTTTLYAVWQAVPTDIKVSNISVSGTNSIDLNTSSPKVTLTATVSPSNAANKSVTWQSSNNKVATVSSAGVVTGVEAGAATITAQANDGSGIKATYKITVTKSIAIVIGASQVTRLGGASYANIQSYTTGNHTYQRSNNTLKFIYKSGTGIEYQQDGGAGWTKAKEVITSYSGKKDYVTFHIFLPLTGNTIKDFTCSEINTNNTTIESYAYNYESQISALRDSGYNAYGYVVSMHPLKPGQATSKYVVTNSDDNRCAAKYRSNYKYHDFNATMKNLITTYNNSGKYEGTRYLALFSDIMDTSNSSSYSFKSGWTSYSTTDGIHWDNATAVKYFNAMLNKAGTL